MQYYGTRLSENISRREPEGYLLCLNVPVARTGPQDYLPEELGLNPNDFYFQPVINPKAEGGLGGDRKAPRSEGGPEGDPEGGLGGDRKAPHLIPVQRPAEEVFAPETIASFEGMPVTNDHPPDGVTVDNIRALQKGHAHNVRRGTGEESDLLLADLIITDPFLIDAILAGKREISCGYTYELHEENGQYIQRKIRGNHVAVVDVGRAGRRVSIRDHKGSGGKPSVSSKAPPEPSSLVGIENQKPHSERSPFSMKKSLFRKLTKMARDGDPDAIEALVEAVEGGLLAAAAEAESSGETVTEGGIVRYGDPRPGGAARIEVAEIEIPAPAGSEAAPGTETETAAVAVDSDTLTAILERLDQLIALISPASPAADEDPDIPATSAAPVPAEEIPEELAEVVEEALEAAEVSGGESALEAAVSEVVEAVLSEGAVQPSVVLEPDQPVSDEDDPESILSVCTADALRKALSAVNPLLRALPPQKRRKVCADIAARVSRKCGRDSVRYAALISARKPARDNANLGRRIMAKRNPNYKE